jgi:acetyl-CoA carboxylase biotin carboxylase subunit
VIRSVLVANRGEIARRIIRTCRRLGVRTVAAHSEGDRDWPFVAEADEAIVLGPAPARESYLNIDRVLAAARASGADAVHPGYGFLSENWRLAKGCEDAGLVFIGPPWPVLQAMGDKIEARRRMAAAGLPTVPGSHGGLESLEAARSLAAEVGYPVMLKAAAGGGGRGMRIVREPGGLPPAWATCQAEAGKAFGSSHLYLEKFVDGARHVEVQILGDRNGIRVHLGDRDCSIQRRHQKLVEESPAPAIAPETRAGLARAALAVANAVNYVSAGTVEFLVAPDGRFHFIEMNTRIQVEHPVTEMVTGIDLIREQIRIAAGEPLGYRQDAIRASGHAIECRINAEDPETFVPSPGRVTTWLAPGGPRVRVDSHLMAGALVPPQYDSLIAKVIVHGDDRAEAIARMRRALSETIVEGVKTTVPYHLKLLSDPAFVSGEFIVPTLEHAL